MIPVRTASPFHSNYFYGAQPLQRTVTQMSRNSFRQESIPRSRAGSVGQSIIQPITQRTYQASLERQNSMVAPFKVYQTAKTETQMTPLNVSNYVTHRQPVQNAELSTSQFYHVGETRVKQNKLTKVADKNNKSGSSLISKKSVKSKENNLIRQPQQKSLIKRSQVDIMIPTVHAQNVPPAKDQDKLLEQFLADLDNIVTQDKELLKAQWLLYQKYGCLSIYKAIIQDTLRLFFQKECADHNNLINCLLGLNAMKKICLFIDTVVEEKNFGLLLPFSETDKGMTLSMIENQLTALFVSPGFFVNNKEENNHTTQLSEMQRLMKLIIELRIKSETAWLEFCKKYKKEQLQQLKLFEKLSVDGLMTPKSIAQQLPNKNKPDYCLHMNYRMNPMNCLQVTAQQFYGMFC